MKRGIMEKKKALNAILVLGVLGLFLSLYLIKNHYTGIEKGSACDFSEAVSCSLVNTSVYSELFNVPVAVFGALWCVILLLLTQKAKKKDGAVATLLLEWNVLGFLFVLYMIYAEIMLKAICPACTLVHIITAITLVLSYLLYKQEHKSSFQETWKTAKPWLILAAVLFIIPIIIFNLPQKEKTDYTPIAKCLAEKNVVMYGSFRCAVCAKVKEDFGESFKEVPYVECHPQGEDNQWQRCQQKQIEGTPTWIMEPQGIEIQRHRGYLSPEEVADFAGCRI